MLTSIPKGILYLENVMYFFNHKNKGYTFYLLGTHQFSNLNLKLNKVLKRLNFFTKINFQVKWPIVVTSYYIQGEGNYWHSYSVRLYDIEEKCLIRKIEFMASDVTIHDHILMACGPRISYPGLSYQSYARFTTMLELKIWNMDQLLDQSVKLEQIANRTILTQSKSVDTCEIIALDKVGSNVLMTVDNKLIQRSFWP